MNISEIADTLKTLIREAESFTSLEGSQKREWVINQINERIDLRWLNETQEAALFGFGFDVIVALVKSA